LRQRQEIQALLPQSVNGTPEYCGSRFLFCAYC
jgi:hypothetical protein